jgi:hypothetical protein
MASEILGHGNCPRIRPISTYDMAKLKYESTKPIRGRNPEVRPLGDERRYTWYQINKSTIANQADNTQYDTYTCQLYGTNCVEFYPNGDITLRTGGWSTFTTGSMINFVLWHMGKIVSEGGKWYFVNKRNESFRWEGKELRLKRDGEHLVPKDAPVQEYKRVVSRKAMNAMRKKYRPIIEYGKNMLAIEPTFDRLALEDAKLGIKSLNLLPSYNWIAPNVGENRSKIFQLMDEQIQSGDLELLYDIARYVATSAGRYSYRLEKFVCYPEQFTKTFDELLKHEYKDDVFISEPVDIGVIFNDRNKKYFNK